MNDTRSIPPSLVFAFAGIIIVAAIAAVIISLFGVPFPSVFQYRLNIFLVCFALSAITCLLFTAKAEIKATASVISLTLGGPAVVWVAAVLLFSMVLPETSLRKEYDLNFNLVFPDDEKNPANPFTATVTGYIQKFGDTGGPRIYDRLPIRGEGGLVYKYFGLSEGDKIYVLVQDDEGRSWRSDEMVIPSAHLKLTGL